TGSSTRDGTESSTVSSTVSSTEVADPPPLWRPAAAGRKFELPTKLPGVGTSAHPLALIALRVAAGTYVRSFARDLGVALGVPAHLAGLVRTASGRLDLGEAVPLDELATAPAVEPRSALELTGRSVDGTTATAI